VNGQRQFLEGVQKKTQVRIFQAWQALRAKKPGTSLGKLYDEAMEATENLKELQQKFDQAKIALLQSESRARLNIKGAAADVVSNQADVRAANSKLGEAEAQAKAAQRKLNEEMGLAIADDAANSKVALPDGPVQTGGQPQTAEESLEGDPNQNGPPPAEAYEQDQVESGGDGNQSEAEHTQALHQAMTGAAQGRISVSLPGNVHSTPEWARLSGVGPGAEDHASVEAGLTPARRLRLPPLVHPPAPVLELGSAAGRPLNLGNPLPPIAAQRSSAAADTGGGGQELGGSERVNSSLSLSGDPSVADDITQVEPPDEENLREPGGGEDAGHPLRAGEPLSGGAGTRSHTNVAALAAASAAPSRPELTGSAQGGPRVAAGSVPAKALARGSPVLPTSSQLGTPVARSPVNAVNTPPERLSMLFNKNQELKQALVTAYQTGKLSTLSDKEKRFLAVQILAVETFNTQITSETRPLLKNALSFYCNKILMDITDWATHKSTVDTVQADLIVNKFFEEFEALRKPSESIGLRQLVGGFLRDHGFHWLANQIAPLSRSGSQQAVGEAREGADSDESGLLRALSREASIMSKQEGKTDNSDIVEHINKVLAERWSSMTPDEEQAMDELQRLDDERESAAAAAAPREPAVQVAPRAGELTNTTRLGTLAERGTPLQRQVQPPGSASENGLHSPRTPTRVAGLVTAATSERPWYGDLPPIKDALPKDPGKTSLADLLNNQPTKEPTGKRQRLSEDPNGGKLKQPAPPTLVAPATRSTVVKSEPAAAELDTAHGPTPATKTGFWAKFRALFAALGSKLNPANWFKSQKAPPATVEGWVSTNNPLYAEPAADKQTADKQTADKQTADKQTADKQTVVGQRSGETMNPQVAAGAPRNSVPMSSSEQRSPKDDGRLSGEQDGPVDSKDIVLSEGEMQDPQSGGDGDIGVTGKENLEEGDAASGGPHELASSVSGDAAGSERQMAISPETTVMLIPASSNTAQNTAHVDGSAQPHSSTNGNISSDAAQEAAEAAGRQPASAAARQSGDGVSVGKAPVQMPGSQNGERPVYDADDVGYFDASASGAPSRGVLSNDSHILDPPSAFFHSAQRAGGTTPSTSTGIIGADEAEHHADAELIKSSSPGDPLLPGRAVYDAEALTGGPSGSGATGGGSDAHSTPPKTAGSGATGGGSDAHDTPPKTAAQGAHVAAGGPTSSTGGGPSTDEMNTTTKSAAVTQALEEAGKGAVAAADAASVTLGDAVGPVMAYLTAIMMTATAASRAAGIAVAMDTRRHSCGQVKPLFTSNSSSNSNSNSNSTTSTSAGSGSTTTGAGSSTSAGTSNSAGAATSTTSDDSGNSGGSADGSGDDSGDDSGNDTASNDDGSNSLTSDGAGSGSGLQTAGDSNGFDGGDAGSLAGATSSGSSLDSLLGACAQGQCQYPPGLFNAVSPGEKDMLASTDGPAAALSRLPMSPSQLVNRVLKDGLPATMKSLLPKQISADLGPSLQKMMDGAGANQAALFAPPKDSGSASQGPLMSQASVNHSGGDSGSAANQAPVAAAPAAAASKPANPLKALVKARQLASSDIYHSHSRLSIFAIVSARIAVVAPRVMDTPKPSDDRAVREERKTDSKQAILELPHEFLTPSQFRRRGSMRSLSVAA
jgi:hypothetical protein